MGSDVTTKWTCDACDFSFKQKGNEYSIPPLWMQMASLRIETESHKLVVCYHCADTIINLIKNTKKRS